MTVTTARPKLVIAKRLVSGILAAALLAFAPAQYAFADGVDGSTAPASTSCSPVATPPSGLQQPNGSDYATYSYNSCTGLWENDYYTWNPQTKVTTPKSPYLYYCNSSTWNWEYKKWVYSPSRGIYYQTTIVVGQLPAGAPVDPSSLSPCAPSAITNTGPDSTNVISDGTNSSADLGSTTNASMNNSLASSVLSGGALVNGNTLGGSAISGDATAMDTIINALQSVSSLSGGQVATFTATIDGDVQGNLIIDPSQLQPATNASGLANTDVTVNNAVNGQINNDINLAAASGDAAVSNNTNAGSATTGNATAIANVINMLNSMVTSGQSFVGVININGNMHGDILMPQSFLDNLIASNAPNTTLSLSPTQAGGLGITNTNNLSTTNNISNSATSGSATVDHNTAAGSATTGNASTQVRVFNLTGSQVVGANCLLVFVNVSGTWVGVIMNAPAGTTAAALGSGISEDGVIAGDLTNNVNDSITNNIGVSATSGNADVTNNTSAGDATSGNANTAVNLLNMNNSAFSMTGWFGILFINIFGNWYGNLGVYTPPVAPTTPHTPAPKHQPKPFQFVSTSYGATNFAANGSSNSKTLGDLSSQLAHTTAKALANAANQKQAKASLTGTFISAVIVVAGLTLFTAERVISRRQAHGQA